MNADENEVVKLIDELFRSESGKLVAVLTRIFGSENLALAEDVVQDAHLQAMRQWPVKGVPVNPMGWLFKVAKNKALDILNHEKYKRQYSSDVAHFLQSEWTVIPALDLLFSEQEILDDQLRMMFTCCHPSISADSQVALTLKTLCGFSIAEISKAFLTNEENINKRLVRARQKIREGKVLFEVPGGKYLEERLNKVLETIYLLFNEGYSASVGNTLIRYELCEEAIRLAELIGSHPAIEDKSAVYALLALMQFNASRFKARADDEGNILTLAEQDRSQWDRTLIRKGFYHLGISAVDNKICSYHILASISALHCSASDFASTDWKSILSLYDSLLQIDHSPVVSLNRAIALSHVSGAENAIEELDRIKDNPAFTSYHLLYSTLAELYMQQCDFNKGAEYLEKAISFSHLQVEKDLLYRKLDACRKKIF